MDTYNLLPNDGPSDSVRSKSSPNRRSESGPRSMPKDTRARSHRALHRTKAAQSHTLLIFRSLTYELLSFLAALGSFIGLLVLLKAYDDKPEPSWSFGPRSPRVTLNAMVSIVSTIFRSCILFPVATCTSQFGWIWMSNSRGRSLQDLPLYNSASNGPLGSLFLLWRLRFWHFASLGASITLAAFALGPFFQQSVAYEIKSVFDPDFPANASAAAAYSWGDSVSGWKYPQSAHEQLPYNMTAAIFGGLYAPDPLSMPKPPSSCPTGTCTWDSFGTLSVNSRCVDVSSDVSIIERTNSTGYFLKASKDPYLQRLFNSSTEWNIFHLVSSMPSMEYPSNVEPFLDLTAAMVIVHWAKVMPNNPSETFSLLKQNSTIEAFRCAIYFSAKEVRPQVTNGVYSEEVLQEVTRPENVQLLEEKEGVRKFFVYLHDAWIPLVYRLPGLAPGKRNTFTVPRGAFIPIYAQLADLLDGRVSDGLSMMSQSTAPLMLYKADSIVQSIQNIADSITTEMRRNESSTNPDQVLQGQVWIQQQFVVVRWAWLVLPAITLVLTSLFLAATILETRRKDIGVWLSSPLALFFNGHLDSSGKDVLSNASSKSLNTADGMVQVAAGLTAIIVQGSRTINVVAKEPVKEQDEDIEMRSLRRFDSNDISVGDGRTMSSNLT